MNNILFLSMLILISNVFLTLNVNNESEKWTTLFDGKSLNGWKVLNGTAEYKVENDEIVGTSKTVTPNTFFVTEKNYGKTELGSDIPVQVPVRSKSAI
ncbi:family 16 glycoside hydrolase [Maribellus comscasis]|uniref:family 16 glycoside hydrolase n=1 Tax=Maribellus comscasis TaxID=2681766 RepID=UPI001C2CDB29|nr:family 16 glycoside hydrolase [Maribellus comscasis]